MWKLPLSVHTRIDSWVHMELYRVQASYLVVLKLKEKGSKDVCDRSPVEEQHN